MEKTNTFAFGMFPPHRAVKTKLCGKPVWQVWRQDVENEDVEVLVKLFTDATELDAFVGAVEDSEMVGL